LCVPRQYARFCGIVHGEKTQRHSLAYGILLLYPIWRLI